MQPPLDYDHPSSKLFRLLKASYYLKQEPNAWFAKFCTLETQVGFSSNSYDHALFIRNTFFVALC